MEHATSPRVSEEQHVAALQLKRPLFTQAGEPSEEEKHDAVRFGEAGWKDRYYQVRGACWLFNGRTRTSPWPKGQKKKVNPVRGGAKGLCRIGGFSYAIFHYVLAHTSRPLDVHDVKLET